MEFALSLPFIIILCLYLKAGFIWISASKRLVLEGQEGLDIFIGLMGCLINPITVVLVLLVNTPPFWILFL